MNRIYLPIDDVQDFECFSIYDKDTIRAYKTMPSINSNSDYVDFYINSHYLEKEGIQSWGQWTSSLPTCIAKQAFTNDVYYRNDFPDILLMFIILMIFCFYLPYRLISRIFGKWLRI